jgi:hypothetical protein
MPNSRTIPTPHGVAPNDQPQAIPDGWRWVLMSEVIAETRNGLYKPDTFYGRGTPILKMFNIGRLDGTWNLETLDRLEVTEAEFQTYRLHAGDLLLNRVNSRELVGKCAVGFSPSPFPAAPPPHSSFASPSLIQGPNPRLAAPASTNCVNWMPSPARRSRCGVSISVCPQQGNQGLCLAAWSLRASRGASGFGCASFPALRPS